MGICGYGYIHGYPRKICGYGYGYGWIISYPRQAWSMNFLNAPRMLTTRQSPDALVSRRWCDFVVLSANRFVSELVVRILEVIRTRTWDPDCIRLGGCPRSPSANKYINNANMHWLRCHLYIGRALFSVYCRLLIGDDGALERTRH